MKRTALVLCAALVAVLGACGEETPTGVGEDLLPPDVIQTFEVVLDADDFLVFDTAFGLYSEGSAATFGVIANDYRDEFDSRILVRFELPSAISVLNDEGRIVRDDTPVFTGGEIVLVVDTLVGERMEMVEAYHTTESWHRLSANWTFRVDSGGVRLPWSEPGGSPGALIGQSPVSTDSDTVTIALDSNDLEQWADTTNEARGALIGVGTPGERLRTAAPTLRVRAISDLQPDTVVQLLLTPTRTIIYSPEFGPESSELRVGGTPAWRGVLRLRDRLDTVTVACPTSPGCRIPLSRTNISYAALLLQPVPTPGGRDPELPVSLTAHLMLPSPQIPLQRSPISEAVSGTRQPIPVSSFSTPGAPLVELALTELLGLAASDPDASDTVRPSHVALVQTGTETFGFASFGAQPRLRLVLSITQEMQLP